MTCPRCGQQHSPMRSCTPVRQLNAEQLGVSDRYTVIAASLKQSYPSITPEWVREVEDAARTNQPLPHGVVGMLIRKALQEWPKA